MRVTLEQLWEFYIAIARAYQNEEDFGVFEECFEHIFGFWPDPSFIIKNENE